MMLTQLLGPVTYKGKWKKRDKNGACAESILKLGNKEKIAMPIYLLCYSRVDARNCMLAYVYHLIPPRKTPNRLEKNNGNLPKICKNK